MIHLKTLKKKNSLKVNKALHSQPTPFLGDARDQTQTQSLVEAFHHGAMHPREATLKYSLELS